MIPVSTLYDEYIERRKFTEQKNPFEYIVPPPSRGSEQKSEISDFSGFQCYSLKQYYVPNIKIDHKQHGFIILLIEGLRDCKKLCNKKDLFDI